MEVSIPFGLRGPRKDSSHAASQRTRLIARKKNFFFGWCCLVAKLCLTLCNSMNCNLAWLLCPWDFPGKSTGVDCHFLFRWILTQGLNPRLLHRQADSSPLSHQGSPLLSSYNPSSAHFSASSSSIEKTHP